MKKLVASVGLVAIGASGLNAVVAQDTGATPHSPLWPFSISASLKGFYDDNINTQPDTIPVYNTTGQQIGSTNNPAYQHAFGFQVSPAVNFNWKNEQTTFKTGLTYTYRQYDKNFWDTTQNYDQDFTFDADLAHQFTEAYGLEVKESFVIGQEPDTLRSGYAATDLQRVSGNNIQNNGSGDFTAQLTPLFGLDIGYQNSLSDYHDKTLFFYSGQPNLAARLNRIEQYWHLDTKWHNWSQTTAIFGYTYSQVDYTTAGGRPNLSPLETPGLLGFEANGHPLYSDSRNYRAHYVYVGADSQLTSKFTGSVKVGFRATDYYNDETQSSIPINPYANVNLTYNYGAESYLRAGFNYDRNATSVVGNPASAAAQGKNGNLTTDQESAVLFGSIRHQLRPLMPNLYAGALVQYQTSKFNGGQYDGKSQQYFLCDLSLEYRVPHELTGLVDLSLTASYNFDKSESNVGGASPSYDRNRVFLGLTASY